MVYVSMTGFRPKGFVQLPAFWWRTITSIAQARQAPGNIAVMLKMVAGVYHTMTVWSDIESMKRFVTSGAHLRAMKDFRKLGSGRTCGCTRETVPDWQDMYEFWRLYGRDV